MQADRILASRLARSGLAADDAKDLAHGAACLASDFSRDAALLALAARFEGLTRERVAVRAVDPIGQPSLAWQPRRHRAEDRRGHRRQVLQGPVAVLARVEVDLSGLVFSFEVTPAAGA